MRVPFRFLNCEHRVVARNLHWQVTNDIRYVLFHAEVAAVMCTDPELLEEFCRLLGFVHQMSPHIRIPEGRAHVEVAAACIVVCHFHFFFFFSGRMSLLGREMLCKMLLPLECERCLTSMSLSFVS